MAFLLPFIVLSLVECLQFIQAQQFPICQSNAGQYYGPKLPSLPTAFTSKVEANFVDLGYSMLMTEFYDKDANKGAIRRVIKGRTSYAIYNYNYNEMMAIDEQNKTCTMQEIQTMHGRPLFGRNSSKIEGIADLFRFGSQFNETYLGNATIRGIPCYHWQACINHVYHNDSYLLDYYFSIPGWSMPNLGDMQVVRSTINGTSKISSYHGNRSFLLNTTRSFYHVYDFFSFVAGKPPADAFQVPNGIFCEGMKDRKPIPQWPPVFSLEQEIVMPYNKSILHHKEYYDFHRNLMMYQKDDPSKFGEAKIIHDFYHGVQYNISGYVCRNVSRLSKMNIGWDGKETKDGHFKLMSPSEMLFRGNRSALVYIGTGIVRGIDADVWRIKQVAPWSSSNETTLQTADFYFSNPSWNMKAGSLLNQSQVPLKISNYYGPKMNLIYTQNILKFDGESIPLHLFSIGVCFKGDRYVISLRFTGNWDEMVYRQEIQFNLAVREAIVKASNISALRVDGLKNGEGKENIMVWFTLLGEPPIPLPDAPPENDLQQAAADLEKKVRAGDLVVTWNNPIHKKQMKVVADKDYFYNSMVKPTTKPGGHKGDKRSKRKGGVPSGAVIGIAFLMIAIGILIGLAIAHVVMKRRGSSLFQYQRQE